MGGEEQSAALPPCRLSSAGGGSGSLPGLGAASRGSGSLPAPHRRAHRPCSRRRRQAPPRLPQPRRPGPARPHLPQVPPSFSSSSSSSAHPALRGALPGSAGSPGKPPGAAPAKKRRRAPPGPSRGHLSAAFPLGGGRKQPSPVPFSAPTPPLPRRRRGLRFPVNRGRGPARREPRQGHEYFSASSARF